MSGGSSVGMSLPQNVKKKSLDFAGADEVWTTENPAQVAGGLQREREGRAGCASH